jgi:hypothetical protein
MLPIVPPTGKDPAQLGYPLTLPLEVALRAVPLPQLLDDYGLTKDQWDVLRFHSGFIADVKHWMEELKKDGMSFKVKAKLQADQLLSKSWAMIDDKDVPAAVRADLIKATVRWAGLEPSKADGQGAEGSGFSITINLA